MAETIIEPTNIEVKAGMMTITFTPDSVGRLSDSGKNMVVASTGGFIQVGELKISVNVIQKRR